MDPAGDLKLATGAQRPLGDELDSFVIASPHPNPHPFGERGRGEGELPAAPDPYPLKGEKKPHAQRPLVRALKLQVPGRATTKLTKRPR